MKMKTFIVMILAFALVFGAGTTVWGIKGGIPANDKKPPPSDDPQDPPEVDDYAPVCDADFWFWRWGHMDGPHDASYALGISRDGKVAVGGTDVVDFFRAWRSDIDWAIATDDGIPPLYNELQVQEDIGVINPSRTSTAYAASDLTCDSYTYDKYNKDNLDLDWCDVAL